MAKLTVQTTFLSLLSLFCPTMPTMASATKRSSLFNKVAVNFTSDMLFDQPATSTPQCVVLCSNSPCCDRAIFTQGRCEGHKWTDDNGGDTTLLWELHKVSTNSAYGKPAVQSSTYDNLGPERVVDGDPSSCSDISSVIPIYWQVDLQATYSDFSVTIINSHIGAAERLRVFDIYIYTEDPVSNPNAIGSLCYQQNVPEADDVVTLQCSDATAPGRFLRMTMTTAYFYLCEVQVWARPVCP